jgi:hypothetical protein
MMKADASKYLRQSSWENVTKRIQARKHQVCDHCGGGFGLVTHRWWGNKFCKKACQDAYVVRLGSTEIPSIAGSDFQRAPRRADSGCALIVSTKLSTSPRRIFGAEMRP